MRSEEFRLRLDHIGYHPDFHECQADFEHRDTRFASPGPTGPNTTPGRILLRREAADCDDYVESKSSVSAKHRPTQQNAQLTEKSRAVTPSNLRNHSLLENSKISVGQATRK